jgi:hypothetical protein
LTPAENSHPFFELLKALDARPQIPPVHHEPHNVKASFLVVNHACLLRLKSKMHLPLDDTPHGFGGSLRFFLTGAQDHNVVGIAHTILACLSHLPIKPLEVDVRSQRAENASVRCSFLRCHPHAVLHHAGFQEHAQ